MDLIGYHQVTYREPLLETCVKKELDLEIIYFGVEGSWVMLIYSGNSDWKTTTSQRATTTAICNCTQTRH